jgi:hypothetical protein
MLSPETTAEPANDLSINPASPLSTPVVLSRVLVAIAFVAQIIVAWRFWALTWDDSAITLGFARTFAHTGRIEPTPGSGIVEGYSTTLWMLLMAAVAKFVTSPATLLVIAKISTLLLNLTSILLIRRWFLSWTSETIANLVAGSFGCGLMFYETINGMETPLVLTLVFVMLLLLPQSDRTARWLYLLAGSAFLLTRWEAAWLLVPFVLVDRPRRRALISSATWLAVFLISNIVRWRYFGSLLPNTIIAKRGVPYITSSFGTEIHRHLGEPVFILASFKIIFLVVAFALLYEGAFMGERTSVMQRLRPFFRESFRDSWQLRFTLLFTLFSLVLTTAIGANWGPAVRSFYCGWPFLFCLFLLPLSNLRVRTLTWATAALCLFALLRMTVHVQELRASDAPVYMPRASVGDIATIATLLSEVQSAAHHTHLLYAGPDMGAVMLYTNDVRLIDLGLLCDSYLAHHRYPAIDSYVLQQRQPDVIEVHDFWTKLTNLQAYPIFRERYRPVYIHGIRVFLTRTLIAKIDPARLTEKSFGPAGHPSDSDLQPTPVVKYTPIDYRLNQTFGTYLVLN